ncbi:MAG: biotin--[acetyl-CoA-carboxylase] ligase [Planctomycetota bacterium]|jgi:BirA family biotin operon repressor/biotin-[acetyl-CoA-carboxylase] ligase
MLVADDLFGGRGGPVVVGCDGEVLQRVDSTMEVARDRLRADAPDGYVVLAEHQSAGRGRAGAWECPPGRGLLMSVVLRIGLPSDEQKLVAIMGAVAVAEAVGGFGIEARIKWPNDVVVVGSEPTPLQVRKLGGVLAETVPRGDAAPAHVLGIGLNVNQSADELPADAALAPTSMRIERGRELERVAVCRALLAELDSWYRRLAMGQREHVLARWRRRSCLLGREVSARVGGHTVRGKVAGIRSTGELILESGPGRQLLLSDEKGHLIL